MKSILCLIAAAALLCGCHMYPEPEVLPNHRVFSAPEGQVWPQLLREVSDRYPVDAVDRPSGFISTTMHPTKVGRNYTWKWIQGPSRYLFRTVAGLSVALTCRVGEADGKTKVEIIPDFEVLHGDGWSRYKSNGHLENEIFDAVAGKLKETH